LEQQAKERLTGGAILVVLLVLLVPELLSGPRPPPQPAPAQPDQAPMRSYTMDLGESVHATSAPVAASTAVPPASEPAARLPVPSAPAPLPAPPPPPPQTQPRTATVVPTPRPTRRPPAADGGRPTHAANAPRSGAHSPAGWTVQLGTFSRRDNAAKLVASLKSHGFSGSIAETTRNGHTFYRVRVGAERDRASAQKLLARLQAAGERGGEIIAR
jgi:cell division septation protein DedD